MRDGIELTLGHSPDADDVAMWWAMEGPAPAVPTFPFRFRLIADDVQALNRRAIERGDLDVTAGSAHAYAHARGRYAILRCGSSFGEGYGPVLVAAKGRDAGLASVRRGARVAVPGLETTAMLVASLAIGPGAFEPVPMPFSRIAPAVTRGEVDAGVLIHEAQVGVERLGLVAVCDLGAWWGERTGLPLPLGLNMVRRDTDERFGRGVAARVAEVLSRSIAHARSNPVQTRRVLRERAGERPEWRDDALVRRYLEMYVNEMTQDMGERGVEALRRLYAEGAAMGLCPEVGEIDVV